MQFKKQCEGTWEMNVHDKQGSILRVSNVGPAAHVLLHPLLDSLCSPLPSPLHTNVHPQQYTLGFAIWSVELNSETSVH